MNKSPCFPHSVRPRPGMPGLQADRRRSGIGSRPLLNDDVLIKSTSGRIHGSGSAGTSRAMENLLRNVQLTPELEAILQRRALTPPGNSPAEAAAHSAALRFSGPRRRNSPAEAAAHSAALRSSGPGWHGGAHLAAGATKAHVTVLTRTPLATGWPDPIDSDAGED